MNQTISLDQTRRHNLLKIIADKGFKSTTAFAKQYGLFTSNLSLILNGSREFTDRLAKNIESKLGIEPGTLSKFEARNDESYLINNFTIVSDSNNVDQLKDDGTFLSINQNLLELDKNNIQDLISLPASSMLDRESMAGILNKNSCLVFDKSQTQLIDGKIYLVNVKNKILIRKFSVINDQCFFITSLPDIYKEILATNSYITVIGKLIYEINTVVKH